MVVLIFDLDDTLYDEMTFRVSGLIAVAHFLGPLLNLSFEQIKGELIALLQVNHLQIFDRFLIAKKCYSKKLVHACLAVYRGHHPHLKLYPDAKKCLQRYQKIPKYVVTDGNKLVQKRKFEALGLTKYIKKCLCTSAYGLKHAKPSPYCFLKICEWENVAPGQVIYVADNPHKDFRGIKPLGFQTVRILTGPYQGYRASDQEEADYVVRNWQELYSLKII